MDIIGNISVLENDMEYEVIDTIEDNEIKYILFSNINNVEDICIRKIITKDNEEYFSMLDDMEFYDIMNKFVKKNENLFE